MSNKLKASLDAKPKQVDLTPYELNYLRSLDQIGGSFAFYIDGLKAEYLKIVSVEKHGYKPDEDLNFEIDLKDDSGKLMVTKLPKTTARPSQTK